MASFSFPRTPLGSLEDLWSAVFGLLPQVAAEGTTVRGVNISTAETPVAHGLKTAPRLGIPVASADVRIWETREPDARFGYFAASAVTTASVRFVP